MATAVYMPKNGMDMQEGRIIHWLKNVGDHVEMDEPIMEIETDKITMEAESPATGTLLAQLYPDDTTVPVLTTIGWIGEPGEKIPEEAAPAGDAAPAPEAAPAPAAAPVAGQPAQAEEGEYIKAPLVGTFYTAAGPDAAPFVQVGDKVQKGQTVCILEAMKAMSEIPAPMDCVIEEVLLDNGSLAAFDAPLFRVRRL